MTGYIERELLLIGVDGCIFSLHAQAKGDPIQESAIKLVEATRDYIASLSSADVVEVRHARWIKHEGYDECEACHAKTIYGNNYCPSCGALMDKEDEHEAG